MVIDSWQTENFKGLAGQKPWLSLNDFEKQSSKNEIRARLSEKNKDKFLKLCSDNEALLKLARNLALYVGLQNKIYKEHVFSLIMNGVIDNLENTNVETLILAVSENLYPIIYAKVSGRPKGQRLSASLTWDFTNESFYSWIENNNFESISTTELNVKLEYLRKDEVGLLILNKFFDAESILANRGSDGYQKVQDFLDDPSIQALKLKNSQKDWFDVKTSHFILHTKTKYNDATFAMQTLFKVDGDKNVTVIRREFSGF